MAFLDSTGLAHLWGELKAKLNAKANASHTHALDGSTITGTLPVSKGGTGGTTQSAARSGLGLGSMATKSNVDLTGSDVTGALPISKGGTGAETAEDARIAIGAAKNVIWNRIGNKILTKNGTITGTANTAIYRTVHVMIGTTIDGANFYQTYSFPLSTNTWRIYIPTTDGYLQAKLEITAAGELTVTMLSAGQRSFFVYVS